MEAYTDNDFKDIIKRRDPKFDGRFFFGVKTTGIYCRPICPAKPKPENIVIFKSKSEAEVDGYRPCKRCKPDMAPGIKFFHQKDIIVHKALLLIDSGDESLTVEGMSKELSVTTRHLRRLFHQHLGVSPLEVITTKRLHCAKKLLLETSLPITEIALCVGFNSIRRFNESFKKLYKEPPSKFRKNNCKNKIKTDFLEIKIPIREPYDWGYVLKFLKRHTIFGSEHIEDFIYTRYLYFEEGSVGKIKVFESKDKKCLILRLDGVPLSKLHDVMFCLKKIFDTDHNPSTIEGSKKLKSIRVPGSYDSFEVAISIILSQLVSTEQAQKVLEILVRKFGEPIKNPFGDDFEIVLFPKPKDLMNEKLEELGITKVKAHALRELSRLIEKGEIKLSYLEDIDRVKEKLSEIKGVGPWTKELIAMRCLGDSDAFPGKDLIVKRALDGGLIDEEGWSGVKAYLCHIAWRDFAHLLTKKKVKS